jgi:hypothetical protein
MFTVIEKIKDLVEEKIEATRCGICAMLGGATDEAESESDSQLIQIDFTGTATIAASEVLFVNVTTGVMVTGDRYLQLSVEEKEQYVLHSLADVIDDASDDDSVVYEYLQTNILEEMVNE